MRLKNEVKKVNFDEVINLELTVKELIALYGSLAICDTKDIVEWLNRFAVTKMLNHEMEQKDIPYALFEDVCNILRNKGINI